MYPLKAWPEIFVTPSGMLLFRHKMSSLPSLVKIQLLVDLYLELFLETVIEVRLLQPEKTEPLSLVTLF